MASRRPPRDRAKPKPPEASPRRAATPAALDALGEDVRAELIDGVIYKLPMTSGIHGHIAAQILAAIFREAPLVAGWWVQPENDFVAGGQVLRPDVVGWRKVRLPSPSTSGRIDVVPDWICEIHSPANKRHDLRKRYIDPDEKTLTVYRLPFAASEKNQRTVAASSSAMTSCFVRGSATYPSGILPAERRPRAL